jgi:hypothetical protein
MFPTCLVLFSVTGSEHEYSIKVLNQLFRDNPSLQQTKKHLTATMESWQCPKVWDSSQWHWQRGVSSSPSTNPVLKTGSKPFS